MVPSLQLRSGAYAPRNAAMHITTTGRYHCPSSKSVPSTRLSYTTPVKKQEKTTSFSHTVSSTSPLLLSKTAATRPTEMSETSGVYSHHCGVTHFSEHSHTFANPENHPGRETGGYATPRTVERPTEKGGDISPTLKLTFQPPLSSSPKVKYNYNIHVYTFTGHK